MVLLLMNPYQVFCDGGAAPWTINVADDTCIDPEGVTGYTWDPNASTCTKASVVTTWEDILSVYLDGQTATIQDGSTTDLIYETKSSTCSFWSGTEVIINGVWDQTIGKCQEILGGSSSILLSNAIGPMKVGITPILSLSFTGGTGTCKLGSQSLLYFHATSECKSTDETTVYNLQLEDYEITSFDTEFLVDLNKMICLRQGECQSRQLDINASEWTTASGAGTLLTSDSLYTCTQVMPGGSNIVETAWNYQVVGATDNAMLTETGLTVFIGESGGPVCQKSGDSTKDYTFNILRGSCYKSDAGPFYSLNNDFAYDQTSVDSYITDQSLTAIIDLQKNKCYHSSASATECTVAADYNSGIYEYTCSCGGTDYTINHGDAGLQNIGPVMEQNLCENKLTGPNNSVFDLIINLVDDECHDSSGVPLTYSSTNLKCTDASNNDTFLVNSYYYIQKWDSSKDWLIDTITFTCRRQGVCAEYDLTINTAEQALGGFGYYCVDRASDVALEPQQANSLVLGTLALESALSIDLSADPLACTGGSASGALDFLTGACIASNAITAQINQDHVSFTNWASGLTGIYDGYFDAINVKCYLKSDSNASCPAKYNGDQVECYCPSGIHTYELTGPKTQNSIRVIGEFIVNRRLKTPSSCVKSDLPNYIASFEGSSYKIVEDFTRFINLYDVTDELNYEQFTNQILNHESEYVVDLVNYTCMKRYQCQRLELTVDASKYDITATPVFAWNDLPFTCTDIQSGTAATLTEQNTKIYGQLHEVTGTFTFDLSTLECKNDQAATIGTLNLETFRCIGDSQILQLALTQYTMENWDGYLQAKGILMLVDEFKNKCYIESEQAVCDVTETSQGYDCACTSITYSFSHDQEGQLYLVMSPLSVNEYCRDSETGSFDIFHLNLVDDKCTRLSALSGLIVYDYDSASAECVDHSGRQYSLNTHAYYVETQTNDWIVDKIENKCHFKKYCSTIEWDGTKCVIPGEVSGDPSVKHVIESSANQISIVGPKIDIIENKCYNAIDAFKGIWYPDIAQCFNPVTNELYYLGSDDYTLLNLDQYYTDNGYEALIDPFNLECFVSGDTTACPLTIKKKFGEIYQFSCDCTQTTLATTKVFNAHPLFIGTHNYEILGKYRWLSEDIRCSRTTSIEILSSSSTCQLSANNYSLDLSTLVCNHDTLNSIDLKANPYQIEYQESDYVVDITRMMCRRKLDGCYQQGGLITVNWTDLSAGQNADTQFTCEFAQEIDGVDSVQPADADRTVIGDLPDYTDAYTIDFDTHTCTLDADDSEIGTLDWDIFGCVSSGNLVASHKRNKATLTGIESLLTELEVDTLFDTYHDECYNTGETGPCAATIAYDATAMDNIGGFIWTCDCTGSSGTSIEYLSSDDTFYSLNQYAYKINEECHTFTVDIDLTNGTCTQGNRIYILDEDQLKCYNENGNIWLPNASYRFKDWDGFSSDVWVFDHLKGVCYSSADCRPYKLEGSDCVTNLGASFTPTSPVNFADQSSNIITPTGTFSIDLSTLACSDDNGSLGKLNPDTGLCMIAKTVPEVASALITKATISGVAAYLTAKSSTTVVDYQHKRCFTDDTEKVLQIATQKFSGEYGIVCGGETVDKSGVTHISPFPSSHLCSDPFYVLAGPNLYPKDHLVIISGTDCNLVYPVPDTWNSETEPIPSGDIPGTIDEYTYDPATNKCGDLSLTLVKYSFVPPTSPNYFIDLLAEKCQDDTEIVALDGGVCKFTAGDVDPTGDSNAAEVTSVVSYDAPTTGITLDFTNNSCRNAGSAVGAIDLQAGLCDDNGTLTDPCKAPFLTYTVPTGKILIDLCKYVCVDENGYKSALTAATTPASGGLLSIQAAQIPRSDTAVTITTPSYDFTCNLYQPSDGTLSSTQYTDTTNLIIFGENSYGGSIPAALDWYLVNIDTSDLTSAGSHGCATQSGQFDFYTGFSGTEPTYDLTFDIDKFTCDGNSLRSREYSYMIKAASANFDVLVDYNSNRCFSMTDATIYQLQTIDGIPTACGKSDGTFGTLGTDWNEKFDTATTYFTYEAVGQGKDISTALADGSVTVAFNAGTCAYDSVTDDTWTSFSYCVDGSGNSYDPCSYSHTFSELAAFQASMDADYIFNLCNLKCYDSSQTEGAIASIGEYKSTCGTTDVPNSDVLIIGGPKATVDNSGITAFIAAQVKLTVDVDAGTCSDADSQAYTLDNTTATDAWTCTLDSDSNTVYTYGTANVIMEIINCSTFLTDGGWTALVDPITGDCLDLNDSDALTTTALGFSTYTTLFDSIGSFDQNQVDNEDVTCSNTTPHDLRAIWFMGSTNVVCGLGCTGFNYPDGNGCCVACDSSCGSCDNSTGACLSCISGKFLCEGNCYDENISTFSLNGFYASESGGTYSCTACTAPCSECTSDDDCTSCDNSSTQYYYNGDTNRCLNEADCNSSTGYYAESTGFVCATCDDNCTDCSGLATSCTACGTDEKLYSDTDDANGPYVCFAKSGDDDCPENFYIHTDADYCYKCASPCVDCNEDNKDQCLTCVDGKYFKADTFQCLDESPCNSESGFFANASVTPKLCDACTSPCSECDGSATVCTDCVNTHSLYSTGADDTGPFECYETSAGDNCPDNYGTDPNDAGNCLHCNSDCNGCADGNPDECTGCSGDLLFRAAGDECITTTACNALGSHTSVGTNCVPCTSPCDECDGSPTECTSCIANHSLYSDVDDTNGPFLCYTQGTRNCPDTHYFNAGETKCYKCTDNCDTCEDDDGAACLTCDATFVYKADTKDCLTESDCNGTTNFAVDSTSCSGCTNPCVDCSGSITTCLSCNTSTHNPFYTGADDSGAIDCFEKNTASRTNCPSGHWFDSNATHCKHCISPCDNCSDTAADGSTCLDCITDYYFKADSNQCLTETECNNTTNFAVDSTSCSGCTDPCVDCSGSITTCLSCNTSTHNPFYTGADDSGEIDCFEKNTASRTNCPAGHWFDSNATHCKHCISPCDNCSDTAADGETCLDCVADHYFKSDSNDCLTETECNNTTNFAVDSTSCSGCTDPCVDCSGSITTCLSCNTSTHNPFYTGADDSGAIDCFEKNTASRTNCPSGHWFDSNATHCKHCISPCDNCSDTAADGETCLDCVADHYFKSDSNDCLTETECNNTTDFAVDSTSCSGCTDPCVDCSGSITTCLSCNTSTHYPFYTGAEDSGAIDCFEKNSASRTNCPAGHWFDTNATHCKHCISPCDNCSDTAADGETCLDCIADHYFKADSNECLTETECNGTTSFAVDSTSCSGCTSPCQDCDGSITTCTACVSGWHLYPTTDGQDTGPFECYEEGTANRTDCPDGYWYDTNATQCKHCDASCGNCDDTHTDGTKCTSCDGTLFKSDTNQCLSTNDCNALDGYAEDGTDCSQCTSPCLTCGTAVDDCLTCVTTHNLYSDTDDTNGPFECFEKGTLSPARDCPLTHYWSSGDSKCLTCTSPCEHCAYDTDGTDCLTCDTTDTYYIKDDTKKCLTESECNTLTSHAVDGNDCSPCDGTAGCATCGTSITDCTTCLTDFNLYSTGSDDSGPFACYDSTGARDCPDDHYFDGGDSRCKYCISPCLTCSDSDGTQCLTCVTSSTYYFHSATNACLTSTQCQGTAGSAPGADGQTCADCTTPCSDCDTAVDSCTACVSGHAYYSTGQTDTDGPFECHDQASTQCPSDSYYFDSNDNACYFCNSPCATCEVTDGDSCLTCENNMIHRDDNTCTDNAACVSAYGFAVNNGACASCTSPCKDCNPSVTDCLECEDGKNAYSDDDSPPYQCYTIDSRDCPDTHYFDSTAGICKLCNAPCGTCEHDNGDSCLSCADTSTHLYKSDTKECLTPTDCDNVDGFAPAASSGTTCEACTPPCDDCSTNPTTCDSCVSGHAYYATGGDDNTGPFACHDQASTQCPSDSYYYDQPSNSCLYCTSPCSTCDITDGSQCASCVTDFYYKADSNECLNQSDCNGTTGFAVDGNDCVLCESPCDDCGTSKTDCLSCITSHAIYSTGSNDTDGPFECHDKSSTNCPTSNEYYFDSNNNQCLYCNSPCETCNESNGDECLSCDDSGTFFFHSSTNACLTQSECEGTSQFAPDADGVTCSACQAPCLDCDTAVDSCLSCQSGHAFYATGGDDATGPFACHDQSSTQCPSSDYYYTNGDNTCHYCNSPCATCSDTDGDHCLSCTGNLILKDDNTCITEQDCIDQTGFAVNNGACDSCTSPCSDCGPTITDCLECESGKNEYSANDSAPYDCYTVDSRNCPLTHYLDTVSGICLLCHSPCGNCAHDDKDVCLSCANTSTHLYKDDTNQCLTPTECDNVTGFAPAASSGTTCDACTSPCDDCSTNPTTCDSCVSGHAYYATGGDDNTGPFACHDQASTQCPSDSYYYDQSSNSCLYCISPCSTCDISDGSQCASCVTDFYYKADSNTCISESDCNSTTGFAVDGSDCVECQDPCDDCSTSKDQCLTCISTHALYSTGNTDDDGPFECHDKSSTNCPSDSYFYEDSRCKYCTAHCATCDPDVGDSCLTCDATYLLKGTECITPQECSSTPGYAIDGNNCSPCTSPCSECTPTITDCTDCVTTHALYATGGDDSTGPFECHDKSSTNCPTSNVYFYDDPICSYCISPCATCQMDSDGTECLTCVTNFLIKADTFECLNESDCNAVNGFWSNTNSCDECDANACVDCTASATNCIECTSTQSLYNSQSDLQGTGACYDWDVPNNDKCPDGYYLSDTNTCLHCDAECSNCLESDSGFCLACTDTNKFACNGDCYDKNVNTFQLSGYFATENSSVYSCAECTEECSECFGANDFCTECVDGEYINSTDGDCFTEQECLDTLERYPLIVQVSPLRRLTTELQCANCDDNCGDCLNISTNCISCKDGFNFYEHDVVQGDGTSVTYGACHDTTSQDCPDGYYISPDNNRLCLHCHEECSLCDEGRKYDCTQCHDGFFLADFDVDGTTEQQCTDLCPSGQYVGCSGAQECTNGNCFDCDASCQECTQSDDNCTQCDQSGNTPYYFYDSSTQKGNCYDSCTGNTYDYKDFWENAVSNGYSAWKQPDVSDSSNYYEAQNLLTAPKLAQIKDLGIFTLDNLNKFCVSCHEACDGSTCNGPYPETCTTQCKTCSYAILHDADGNFNGCTAQCPTGQFKHGDTNVCTDCSQGCLECSWTTEENCSQCDQNTYLLMGDCFDSCPDSTFPNNINRTCDDCETSCTNSDACCATCSGSSTNCLSCVSDGGRKHNPFTNECFDSSTNCPQYTLESDDGLWCEIQVSEDCDSPCQTCIAGQRTRCVSCEDGFKLKPEEEICSAQCDGGYRDSVDNPDTQCQKCPENCTECSNTSCTECSQGYHLDGMNPVYLCVSECCQDKFEENVNGKDFCNFCSPNCDGCSGEYDYCDDCNDGDLTCVEKDTYTAQLCVEEIVTEAKFFDNYSTFKLCFDEDQVRLNLKYITETELFTEINQEQHWLNENERYDPVIPTDTMSQFQTIYNSAVDASSTTAAIIQLKQDYWVLYNQLKTEYESQKFDPSEPHLTNISGYDYEEGFGNDVIEFNLVEKILHPDLVLKLGAYDYEVVKNGPDLCIDISLGYPHTLDIGDDVQLVHQAFKPQSGVFWKTTRQISDASSDQIEDLTLTITSSEGSEIVQCGITDISFNHSGFPLGQPESTVWTISKVTTTGQTVNEANLQSTLNLELQNMGVTNAQQIQIGSSFSNLVGGKDIEFTLTATAAVSGETQTAMYVLRVTAGEEVKLIVQNESKEFRADRNRKAYSNPLEIAITGCDQVDDLTTYLKEEVDMTISAFPSGTCGSGSSVELEFELSTQRFIIDQLQFNPGVTLCIQIDSVKKNNEGIADSQDVWTVHVVGGELSVNVIEEQITVRPQDEIISYVNLQMDSDATATCTLACTLNNPTAPCQKLDQNNNPINYNIQIQTDTSSNQSRTQRKIVVPQNELPGLKNIELTINCADNFSQNLAAGTLKIITLEQADPQPIRGELNIVGINKKKVKKGDKIVAKLYLDNFKFKDIDVKTTTLKKKSASGNWQILTLSEGSNQYETKEGLIIESIEDEHYYQAVINVSQTSGRSGTFPLSFDTISGLSGNIVVSSSDFTVDDKITITMNISSNINNELLTYRLFYSLKDGKRRFLSEDITSGNKFEGKISQKGDINNSQLDIICLVTRENGKQKPFKARVRVAEGTLTKPDYYNVVTNTGPQTESEKLSALNSLTLKSLTSTELTQVISSSVSQVETSVDTTYAIETLQVLAEFQNQSGEQLKLLLTKQTSIFQTTVINGKNVVPSYSQDEIEIGITSTIKKKAKIEVLTEDPAVKIEMKQQAVKTLKKQFVALAQYMVSGETKTFGTTTISIPTITEIQSGVQLGATTGNGRRLDSQDFSVVFPPSFPYEDIAVISTVLNESGDEGALSKDYSIDISQVQQISGGGFQETEISDFNETPIKICLNLSTESSHLKNTSVLCGTSPEGRTRVGSTTSRRLETEDEEEPENQEWEVCAKFYDESSQAWGTTGITMIEPESGDIDAQTQFCFETKHATIFRIIEEPFILEQMSGKIEWLYEGFLLYILIIINLWLIIGAIIGSNLDSQNKVTIVKGDGDQKESVYVSMKQPLPNNKLEESFRHQNEPEEEDQSQILKEKMRSPGELQQEGGEEEKDGDKKEVEKTEEGKVEEQKEKEEEKKDEIKDDKKEDDIKQEQQDEQPKVEENGNKIDENQQENKEQENQDVKPYEEEEQKEDKNDEEKKEEEKKDEEQNQENEEPKSQTPVPTSPKKEEGEQEEKKDESEQKVEEEEEEKKKDEGEQKEEEEKKEENRSDSVHPNQDEVTKVETIVQEKEEDNKEEDNNEEPTGEKANVEEGLERLDSVENINMENAAEETPEQLPQPEAAQTEIINSNAVVQESQPKREEPQTHTRNQSEVPLVNDDEERPANVEPVQGENAIVYVPSPAQTPESLNRQDTEERPMLGNQQSSDNPPPPIIVPTSKGDKSYKEQVNTETELVVKPVKRQEQAQNLTFCNSFKIYHRCYNVFTSGLHVMYRPYRVFSFCLQMIIFLTSLGGFTHVSSNIQPLKSIKMEGSSVIGFIFTFIIMRMANYLINELFTFTIVNKTMKTAMLVISFLVFIGLQIACIFIMLSMTEREYMEWTTAFFIGLVIEVIVWEICVTCFQHTSIKKMIKGQDPACCTGRVSKPLQRYYSVN